MKGPLEELFDPPSLSIITTEIKAAYGQGRDKWLADQKERDINWALWRSLDPHWGK